MSADSLTWQNLDARGLTFAIVVARFNGAITEKLLEGAREALQKSGATSHRVFHVPGAFELPLAAMKLARRGKRSVRTTVEVPAALPPAEGTPAITGGAGVEQQLESKLAEREALQQKLDAQALTALKLAPVITKTAEVMAKHLREKIKQDPEISAQALRTWIREEEDLHL